MTLQEITDEEALPEDDLPWEEDIEDPGPSPHPCNEEWIGAGPLGAPVKNGGDPGLTPLHRSPRSDDEKQSQATPVGADSEADWEVDTAFEGVVISYHPKSRWAEAVAEPLPLTVVKLEDIAEDVLWSPPGPQDPETA